MALKVGDPELVRAPRQVPGPLDQVRVTRRLGVGDGDHGAVLAAAGALDADDSHEPGHRVAAHVMAPTAHLRP